MTSVFIPDLDSTDSWSETALMSGLREHPACSLSQEHGLVFSGGVDRLRDLDTVEHTLDGEAIGELKKMPEAKNYHCMVALQDGGLFIAGGRNCTGLLPELGKVKDSDQFFRVHPKKETDLLKKDQ